MSNKGRWLFGSAAAATMCLLVLQGLSLRQQQKQTEVAIDRLSRALGDSANARSNPSGPAPTRFVFGQASSVSPDELRAIVREELQALGDRSKAAGAEAKPAAVVSPEQAAENAAAFQEAKRVVDEALAAGVWDARRRDAFRTVRGRLTAEQLEAVSRQLFPAINAQRVRIAVDGPFL